jgi:hypothetical protein
MIICLLVFGLVQPGAPSEGSSTKKKEGKWL